MGFFDEFSKALTPHTEKLGQDFSFHATAIHNKLHAIERAVSDLGRGDIGNKWQRFQIKRKFTSGENFEIGTVPINEIWLIQAIASDGVQEKSPPYVILANQVLLESVIKEGIGFEGIGGNQVGLPGEIISLTAREEGSINCVITLIRRPYPTPKIMADYGKDTDRYSPRATHDVSRDVIGSRTDLYAEQRAELAATEGRQG